MKTMASGHAKGFWRRARNGLLSQDQVMAVDVQLEDDIREIEGLVGGYLRSPQDAARTPGARGGAGQARRPDGSCRRLRQL